MKRETRLTRRETLLKLIAGGGALSLAGCGLDGRSPAALAVLESAETLTRFAQRALLAPRGALAREYRPRTFPSYFRPNGSTAPDDPDYQDAPAKAFADWRLEVGGLVENGSKLSLADLRALPWQDQITATIACRRPSSTIWSGGSPFPFCSATGAATGSTSLRSG